MAKSFFVNMVSDIQHQNTAWRDNSQKSADYYDDLQITQTRMQQLRHCETLPNIGNLIKPAINSVLGHEEQRRVDWMITADDVESEEVAEGLNQQLNEIMRLCKANSVCSTAYKSQIIKGIGWVHVRRNPDPFQANKYIIEAVPFDEIYWDMRSRSQDKADCRWMARRKFMDIDEAQVQFPKHKDLINACVSSNYMTGFEIGEQRAENELRYSEHQQSYQFGHHITQSVAGSERKRIAVYEVYYREIASVKVLKFENGRVEEYDKDNAMHLHALMLGAAKPCKANIKKMRRKWFIGPHEIVDQPSPHPHNYFPFVDFTGYTEDAANTPYGMVRPMIDPQDNYNEAGFEIMRILQHKRITKEEGATKLTDSQLKHETNRRDGIITLNKGKMGALSVEKDWSELQALDGLQGKYAQQIRDFSGIYNTYSGKNAEQASGVAIASLAELGATTLSEINSNYEYGRQRLGELVLAYIVKDLGDKPAEINIRNNSVGSVRKTVCLNMQSKDDPKINNIVAMAKYQVAIADVHSSPGYRQHLNRRWMEMFQVAGQDPVMQSFILEQAIETSEMPNRAEALEKWRKIRGMTDDPEAQAQQEQQQMAQAQQAAAIEQAKTEAEIGSDKADSARKMAQAELDKARAQKVIAEIMKMQQEQVEQANEEKQAMLYEGNRALAISELRTG